MRFLGLSACTSNPVAAVSDAAFFICEETTFGPAFDVFAVDAGYARHAAFVVENPAAAR